MRLDDGKFYWTIQQTYPLPMPILCWIFPAPWITFADNYGNFEVAKNEILRLRGYQGQIDDFNKQ